MYVCMIIYSKSKDQPGKVTNPAAEQYQYQVTVITRLQMASPPARASSDLWSTSVGCSKGELMLCASPWLTLSYSSLVTVPDTS